ncbi:hypothetical protein D9758_012900 [Tetrapyrgos nigripes]|uniref:F-box domain-containing protein n=1 Tax=Tetrapyrgos nigripes TaxID=182062 RepID=A0A8H5CLL9_9AGAR|nr:hypothetical protein D9758_012900 [Tetrapyrgos nigripes]
MCRLPVEILTENFKWRCGRSHLTIGGELNEGTDRFEQSVKTPTLDIAQTCSLWHNIVLSRPSLWTRIEVDLNCDRQSESLVDLVTLYLSRSSPRELTLTIEAWENDGNADSLTETGLSMLLALVKEKHRWKAVEFSLSISVFDGLNFAGECRRSCDCLEELTLPDEMDAMDNDRTRTKFAIDAFHEMLYHTPELHTLKIKGQFSEHLIGTGVFDVRTFILDIRGNELDLDNVFTLLAMYRFLGSLDILPDFDHEPEIPLPPALPNGVSVIDSPLQHLSITVRDDSDSECRGLIASAYLFQYLRARELKDLWIRGTNLKDPADSEERDICFNSLTKFLRAPSASCKD